MKKQKRNREGYEDGVTLLYKHCPVRNFIETDNPIPMLGQYNEFIFDEESLKYKRISILNMFLPNYIKFSLDIRVIQKLHKKF